METSSNRDASCISAPVSYHQRDVGGCVQVATEWLFSVPDHILEKHLGSDPNTPTGEVDLGEENRILAPRRVTLQVRIPLAYDGSDNHTVL